MSSWNQIPVALHQAAIAGKVVDAETGRAVAGVTATITAMPSAFQQWLATRALQHGSAWQTLTERPDRTRTALDGCFRFVDLPDGGYTVSFALSGGTHRYGPAEHAFTVARDAQGLIVATIVQIDLPPTGARGLVQGLVEGTPTALSLARVRVEGTGETAYCDEQGRFYLTSVELGTRTLGIHAGGFLPTLTTAAITEGVVTDLGTLELATA